MPDAQRVEVGGPRLDVGVVVDGETDRIEAPAAFGGLRIEPERELGDAEAGRLAGNATDDAVGLGELHEHSKVEDLRVPIDGSGQVGDRDLHMVDAGQRRAGHEASNLSAVSLRQIWVWCFP